MKQNQRILAALLLCAMLAGCTAQRPASAPETDGSAAAEAMPAAQLETDAAALAAEAEADEAEPVMLFCPAPPEIEGEQAVTVNRQRMQLYHGESGELMRLDEFAAAAGGTLRQKRHADGNYTCHLELPCYSADFYNDDGVIFDGEHWYVPSQRLVMRPEVRAYTDEEENHVHYTTDQPADAVPEGYRVPILMYHAVSDDCWGIRELFVSPQSMEEQLQFLTENGYTTIWFEDLPNIAQYKKPIILTFDDGYDDNYTELFPLLKKYNAKATIFVIADRMDMEHKMTVEQAKEMSDSGLVSIQSHGDYTMNDASLDIVHAATDYGEYDELMDEYLSCIHMSDAAVQELCDYFTKQYEETGRKVVLAFAGDHAPSFVDHVADKTRTEGNDLQILERSTPFFIWANYPLENIDAATSTADSLNRMDMVMLAPTIAQQAGLPLTGYYKYLLAMKQQTPVVTAANDYMKVDGTTGTYGEDESLDAWVKGYLALEYNNIGAHAKRVQSIFGQ